LTLQQLPGKTLYVFPHSHSYNNYRYNYLYFNHLKSPSGGFRGLIKKGEHKYFAKLQKHKYLALI